MSTPALVVPDQDGSVDAPLPAIRTLVVDDHALLREGIRATLSLREGIEVVGEAVNGRQAVRIAAMLHPDIVLMDLRMPGLDGIEATRQICAARPGLPPRVIIVSLFDDDESVYEAIRAGASGFLLKDSLPDQLVDGIRAVADGDALLSPRVTRRLISAFANQPVLSRPERGGAIDLLTERERAVFDLIVRGRDNDAIARELVLARSTVKTHVQHLFDKLAVHDRVQLVIYAYEHGLVSPGAPSGPSARQQPHLQPTRRHRP